MKLPTDTNSLEYAQWLAEVWKKNDQRNQVEAQNKKTLEDLVSKAEIEAGLYE